MVLVEQQDAAGSLVISNDLGGVEDQTTFILSDAVGVQSFETQFAYFGARFVDIAGWPADSAPETESMTCYFVHTALPRLSHVRVSSLDDTADILNGIHEITMRSALSNFMSTPTGESRNPQPHSLQLKMTVVFSLTSLMLLALIYDRLPITRKKGLDRRRAGCCRDVDL